MKTILNRISNYINNHFSPAIKDICIFSNTYTKTLPFECLIDKITYIFSNLIIIRYIDNAQYFNRYAMEMNLLKDNKTT